MPRFANSLTNRVNPARHLAPRLTDEVRDRIKPVNRKDDLKALLSACDYYASRKKQRIYFEYILIAGSTTHTNKRICSRRSRGRCRREST